MRQYGDDTEAGRGEERGRNRGQDGGDAEPEAGWLLRVIRLLLRVPRRFPAAAFREGSAAHRLQAASTRRGPGLRFPRRAVMRGGDIRSGAIEERAMSRTICVAAAQMGPIARAEPRASAVARMMAMMREAHARGARLVVFPELALTSFFPRWWMEDEAELDSFYEAGMPNRDAAPLFDLGRELGVGFLPRVTPSSSAKGTGSGASTPRSWWTRRAASPASTGRCTFRGTTTTSRTGRSSISKRRTSSRATSASRSSTLSAGGWACASATTGAGRRRTGSWG